MYKKILVPLDGSELSEAVLPHVTELAKCTGAEVVLIRVPVYFVYDYNVMDPAFLTSIETTAKTEIQIYLDRVSARLREAGLNVSARIKDGLVADTILECADLEEVDLIAMSTHGRSGFARWLMGSVADKVVHGATAPVLLIRPTFRTETPAATSTAAAGATPARKDGGA